MKKKKTHTFEELKWEGMSYLKKKGIMCCRARVATAALLVIAFVLRPKDTRVIAAICIGGQCN